MEKHRFSRESLVRVSPGIITGQNRWPTLLATWAGLDSAHGDHLFAPARLAISALQPSPSLSGLLPHLHDQQFARKMNRVETGPARL